MVETEILIHSYCVKRDFIDEGAQTKSNSESAQAFPFFNVLFKI